MRISLKAPQFVYSHRLKLKMFFLLALLQWTCNLSLYGTNSNYMNGCHTSLKK
jgi:hypothetical protein